MESLQKRIKNLIKYHKTQIKELNLLLMVDELLTGEIEEYELTEEEQEFIKNELFWEDYYNERDNDL